MHGNRFFKLVIFDVIYYLWVAHLPIVNSMRLACRFALEKYPDEPEAYNVYGMLHIKKRQWSEALEYYSLVISKVQLPHP